MDRETGDNSVNAPVERQQVGDNAVQSQIQSSQAEMSNLGAQRNLDSAQASQQMADKGIVNNLQLTGDANGSKGSQVSDDSSASSNRTRYFDRSPWASNNGGSNTDTDIQSVGTTQKSYNDRSPMAQDKQSDFGADSVQKDYSDRAPDAKDYINPKDPTAQDKNPKAPGVESDGKPQPTDMPKPAEGTNPAKPSDNSNKPTEVDPKSKDRSQFQVPGPSDISGRPNSDSQANNIGSSKAEHSEPVQGGKSNEQQAPRQQPGPRHQPAPLHRPAPVARPVW